MRQKFCALLLSALLLFSLVIPAAGADMSFQDVKSSDWYYSYVKELYEAGVINGTTAKTFSPKGTVTFGQALKLVLVAAGCGEQKKTGSHWASGYYQYAETNGYLPSGLSLGLNDEINRLQIAQLIVNVLDLSRTGQGASPFADTSDASALILYEQGIFEGSVTDGKRYFKPQSSITRAEISAVISRVYAYRQENPNNAPNSGDDNNAAKPTGDYFYFGSKKVYITEEMPKNTYDASLFRTDENGFLTYNSDAYICKTGIDVSRYQGDIDWAQVKAAGVEFAMLRLGYRGYGTGAIVMDPYFKTYIQGAQENGIEVGVYFFSQAINEEEAAEEAEYCMEVLADYTITYPIVFDWEPYSSSVNARTNGLSDAMLTKCAVSFCKTVEAGGYETMVYSNLSYFYLHFDLSQLTDFSLWLAQYTTKPTFYYHFDMWQYTGSGTVPGIDGKVDLDLYLIPKT